MQHAILFLFFFISLSCANERVKTSTPINASEQAPQDTLHYSYQTKKETSPYFVSNDVNTDTAYYKITYPIFEKESVDKAIQPAIFIDRENNATEAARAFLDAFNEFVEENSTTNVHSAWYKESSSKIILNTPLFLTLQTSTQEYTGGAHGNQVTLFTVLDLERLKSLKLEDLVATGQLKELCKIAERNFRKQEGLSDTSTLSKDYFFEDGMFALNDNFGLTKDRLIIYYNEYEIKPYSEGITVLELPYEDISGTLNARGKRYINSIQQ